MQSSRTSALFSRETHKVMYVREITVSFRVMTIEVSQSEEEDRGGFLLFLHLHFFPWTCPARTPMINGSARLGPPSTSSQSSRTGFADGLRRLFPQKARRLSGATSKNTTPCVSLTCIKCPSPPTFECYIAKEGSYFIYRSLILFLNICRALRPGSQSHYAL